ncbi:hypothetical protein WMY93_033922 [Mugilogobius chulae]|uniref:Uncharacterized protein n=1 Tax=Mugilogobius chulae TaxID=88201 RepID=A0AAW0MR74_9GOBI
MASVADVLSECTVVSAKLNTSVELQFDAAEVKDWTVVKDGQDVASCRNGKPHSKPGFEIMTLCSDPKPRIKIKSVETEHFGTYTLEKNRQNYSCVKLGKNQKQILCHRKDYC